MARYTNFADLCASANFSESGYERVWLRASAGEASGVVPVLRVTYYQGEEMPTYYLSGIQIGETEAVDLFNLEMRVHGWVSTERPV